MLKCFLLAFATLLNYYSQTESCITDMDSWMSANRLKLNMDKTELLWAETRYNMSMLNDSGPSLQLNNVTVTVNASQHVRVLGVHLSSDLSLHKHVSSVRSARPAFIIFVNSDASGGRLTLIQRRHSFTPS